MAAHRIPLYFNPDDHDSYDLSSYSVTARGHVRAPHHGVRDNDALRWVARDDLATLGIPAPIRTLLLAPRIALED